MKLEYKQQDIYDETFFYTIYIISELVYRKVSCSVYISPPLFIAGARVGQSV
jgi:hypothetical protein